MRVPVENKIVAGFVFTAVALGVMGWLSYSATQDFIAAQKWVLHSQDVVSQLQAMLATIVETETDQRGYLLTRDTTLLKNRANAAAKIPGQLEQLKELTSDNPSQQEALNQIAAQTQTAISVGNDRIALFKKSGLPRRLWPIQCKKPRRPWRACSGRPPKCIGPSKNSFFKDASAPGRSESERNWP